MDDSRFPMITSASGPRHEAINHQYTGCHLQFDTDYNKPVRLPKIPLDCLDEARDPIRDFLSAVSECVEQCGPSHISFFFMYLSCIDDSCIERLDGGVCSVKSGTHAVRIVGTADVVRLADMSAGRWTVTAFFVVNDLGLVADVAGRGIPRSVLFVFSDG